MVTLGIFGDLRSLSTSPAIELRCNETAIIFYEYQNQSLISDYRHAFDNMIFSGPFQGMIT